MHYDHHYSGPFLENEARALADILEYVGPKGFEAMKTAARAWSPGQFRLQCAFMVGIEGYPIGAFLREFRPDTNETGDYGEDVRVTFVEHCSYPKCKCIVQTSTSQPKPSCPKGLEREGEK